MNEVEGVVSPASRFPKRSIVDAEERWKAVTAFPQARFGTLKSQLHSENWGSCSYFRSFTFVGNSPRGCATLIAFWELVEFVSELSENAGLISRRHGFLTALLSTHRDGFQ